jgi:hypothetical protein
MLRKIVDYKLFLWHYCGFCRFIPPFNTFVLGPVQTSLDRFFSVPVRFFWILNITRTGPVLGPSKKGKKTGPDLKALCKTETDGPVFSGSVQFSLQLFSSSIDRTLKHYSHRTWSFTQNNAGLISLVIVRLFYTSCEGNYSGLKSQASRDPKVRYIDKWASLLPT